MKQAIKASKVIRTLDAFMAFLVEKNLIQTWFRILV